MAVVGSRGLDEACYETICDNVPAGCSEIISGGAQGVDTLAERYARDRALRMTVIRPQYGLFDRSAPIIRNEEIVRRADFVLILWDGASRGTMHVISACVKTGKPYKLLLIRPENEKKG